jgi:drug/metabolite transporter (DMT)-like permease
VHRQPAACRRNRAPGPTVPEARPGLSLAPAREVSTEIFRKPHVLNLKDLSKPANSGLRAALLMCLAVATFSCLDATAKFAGQHVHAMEVVWFRYLGHVLFACLFFRIWSNTAFLAMKRPGLQVLRGVLLLGSTLFNFIALQYLQLAETVSIMFAAPFVVTILAGPFLNEWAGPRRWAAIVVGFAGVLVITQPGTDRLHWAIFLSITSMCCYACYAIMTRKLAAYESHESMLLWSAIIALVVLTPALPFVWTTPEGTAMWTALVATGFFGAFGHFMLIRAFHLADAPSLAPFTYTQIVWMVLIGYLAFDDVPDAATLAGSAIIICSGLYLLYRERKVGGRKSATNTQ